MRIGMGSEWDWEWGLWEWECRLIALLSMFMGPANALGVQLPALNFQRASEDRGPEIGPKQWAH